jgi:hypothetical protein
MYSKIKEPHRRKRYRQKMSKQNSLLACNQRTALALPPWELTYTETFDATTTKFLSAWEHLMRSVIMESEPHE